MTKPSTKTILYLNDNPLPSVFTKNTIPGKEYRLRAALPDIHSIHVICPPDHHSNPNIEPTPLEKKIIIHHILPWPYYLRCLPLFIYGFYYAHKYKPILIEAESPIISGVAAVLIGKILSIPTIVEVRASYHHLIKFHLTFIPLTIKKSILNFIYFRVLTHANAVIANSSLYQTNLNQHHIPSTVINPGLQYPPPTSNQKSSIPIIGYLGRLVPEKGVRLLIDAASILTNDASCPHFKVEIAGNGPEQSSLIDLVNQLNLNHRISFLGQVPNYSTLKRWYLLVNPNLVHHPLEMVNAEAALLGVPVICFGTSRYPETVKHLQTGIKIKSSTSPQLAKAIKHLLTHPSLHHQLSQNGPKFARRHYCFESQVSRLRQLYQQLDLI